MKKETICINNRVKWIYDILREFKGVIKKNKKNLGDKEYQRLMGIYYDLEWNIEGIKYYFKKVEKEAKKWKK